MLTRDMILYLLDELSYEDVAGFDGYRIQKEFSGYSKDLQRGTIQASLSIMLEVASAREKAHEDQ